MNTNDIINLPTSKHGNAWIDIVNYEFLEQLKLGYSITDINYYCNEIQNSNNLTYDLKIVKKDDDDYYSYKYAKELHVINFNNIPTFIVYRYGKHQCENIVVVVDKNNFKNFKNFLDDFVYTDNKPLCVLDHDQPIDEVGLDIKNLF